MAAPVLAAATAIAFAAPGAGAAASGPPTYAGAASSQALDLMVTAPLGLLGAVTDGSNLLRQQISLTWAELDSAGKIGARVNLLEGLLNQGTLSSAGGGVSADQAIIPQQTIAGVLDVGVGQVAYTSDFNQGLSEASSELANLTLSLAPLFDGGALPVDVTQTLDGALDSVTGTVDGLVGQLNTVLGGVEQTVQDLAGQVVDLPTVLPEDLSSLVPDVTSIALVDVGKLWSDTKVETRDGLITAEAVSGVLDLSLLGGLIEVPAFQYRSSAHTAGTPGSASADTEVTTIAVRVAGSDLVKLSGNQLTVGEVLLDLDDPALSSLPVDDLLAPVQDILSQLLNVVGLSVAQGEGVTDVAEDGSFAKAATSAFHLKLSPLNAAGQNDLLAIDLRLLPTDAAVTAAGPASAAQAGPPAQVAAPPQAPVSLPRTGGGAAALLLGALALGGAGVLSRRV